jgi:hypothetical protein
MGEIVNGLLVFADGIGVFNRFFCLQPVVLFFKKYLDK